MTADADWAKKTLESAVNEIISGGLFDDPFLQARPVWQIAGSLLIAECRAREDRYWLIAGNDSPTDLIAGETAASAREAARHFALKWQLAAEKLKAGEVSTPSNLAADDLFKKVAHLVRCAESLYELAEQTSIWE
jgi:hypothetical protein